MARALSVRLMLPVLLAAVSVLPVGAQQDEKSAAILKRMEALYGGVKSLKLTAKTTMKMSMQGMNMDMNGTSAIAAERPNKFSAVSQGQGMMAMAMSNTLVSDGQKMVIYMPMLQSYTEQEAPPNFAGISGNPGGGAGAEAFVLALLSSGVAGSSFFEGIEKAAYVGREEVGGVQCDHLRLSNASAGLAGLGMGEAKIDLWVEAGERPLVRRIRPDISEALAQFTGGGAGAPDPDAAACRENLAKIKGMKERFASAKKAKQGDKIEAQAVAAHAKEPIPQCPSGKPYVLNAVGEDPMCLSGLEGHDLASAESAAGPGPLGEVGAMLEGMEMEMSFDYENWELDASVAPELFVFTPPAGAQKTDDLFGDFGLDGGGLEGFGMTEEEDPAKKLEGQPAPLFKLPLAGGGTFDLAAQKGKSVVILDFWASWCGPCRSSMPGLIKVANDYAGKGVMLIAVNLEESEQKVLDFVKQEGWKVKVALDADYSVGEKYMAEAIPLTVVVGKDGVVAMVHVGASADFSAKLRGKLDELTAKP